MDPHRGTQLEILKHWVREEKIRCKVIKIQETGDFPTATLEARRQ